MAACGPTFVGSPGGQRTIACILTPPPPPGERTGVRPYALACVATAAGIALTRFTWPLFSPTPYAPVFASTAIATHWGSGRAGLLAIALAAAGAAPVFPTAGTQAWTPASSWTPWGAPA